MFYSFGNVQLSISIAAKSESYKNNRDNTNIGWLVRRMFDYTIVLTLPINIELGAHARGEMIVGTFIRTPVAYN